MIAAVHSLLKNRPGWHLAEAHVGYRWRVEGHEVSALMSGFFAGPRPGVVMGIDASSAIGARDWFARFQRGLGPGYDLDEERLSLRRVLRGEMVPDRVYAAMQSVGWETVGLGYDRMIQLGGWSVCASVRVTKEDYRGKPATMAFFSAWPTRKGAAEPKGLRAARELLVQAGYEPRGEPRVHHLSDYRSGVSLTNAKSALELLERALGVAAG